MTHAKNSLDASQPEQNATVHASAGTGKTWLLITRLTRMLLSDIEPGNIVALTFTRKAASEMLSRLHERIESLATNDHQQLDEVLTQAGITPSAAMRRKAQQQFEQLLHAEYPVRISTFHSFCQDLLLRFPLEAEVPPAFDLLNSSHKIQAEAWEALYQKAETRTGSKINGAMQTLFNYCKGLSATTSLLDEFIDARIDWWAWTHTQADPVQFACDNLLQELELEALESTDIAVILDNLFSETFCESLQGIAKMLSVHETKKNLSHASLLLQALDNNRPSQQRYDYIFSVFIVKSSGLPVKPAKAWLSKLDPEQANQLPSLYADLSTQILRLHDILLRIHSWHLSCAWFTAGHALITEFQKIKRQRRLLDFSDLEWKTYQLLNHGDNALWVQYKLDQSIDHLLIDEFQDTSPSQWHMILPVLQEFAASDFERQRSIFIVGDEKQSIYQFRRANPELLVIAAQWLQNNLDSSAFHMDMSRRSSPAIIKTVNAVFGPRPNTDTDTDTDSATSTSNNNVPENITETQGLMPAWQEHHSFHSELWGAVNLLPLVCLEKDTHDDPDEQEFRNPLLNPLSAASKLRHALEADQIADKIQALIQQPQIIKVNGLVRPLSYSDIMILIPRRTHASDIENSLRERKIPFVGAERGTLLQCLEIQDLCALLKIILTPYDNLALAQVLRCPLYKVTEQDLLLLATHSEDSHTFSWFEKLTHLHHNELLTLNSPLLKALQQITHWRKWAGILPVHDLLDRIYHESDLINTYVNVYPESLQSRVHANFSRFIDIALDLDSGRYPGLTRFLEHIQDLHKDTDAPSTPSAAGEDNRVKIITIHSAKGLEAPVVFLANATKSRSRSSGYTAIMDWPTDKQQPNELFIIQNSSANASIIRQKLQRRHSLYEQEKNNLLYVAMTRACQYLFVSGSITAVSDPKKLRASLGWYGMIRDAVEQLLQNDSNTDYSEALCFNFGTPDNYTAPVKTAPNNRLLTDTPTQSARDNTQIDLDFSTDNNTTSNHALDELLNEATFIAPSQHNKQQYSKLEPSNTPSTADSNLDLSHLPSDKVHAELTPEQEQEQDQEQEQEQDQDQQCRGVTLHRILELACRQLDLGQTPLWQQIIFSMSNDTRFLQGHDALQECIQEIKTIFDTAELADYFNPQHYQQLWNEVPVSYLVKSGIVNGLIDRLLLTEDEAIIIDYKSHRITANDTQQTAETFRPQMESYKKGIQKIWPGKKVRCLILFTALAEMTELTS